ncbi:MAG: multiprotein bridging factor aMBF1 [Candidatus Bathyarchaeota archaeon]|nr:TIGR00270 family protein [Candidatus Bathyarchaeota archaeon A05DMB-5]MDH7557142.1 multiprotein bridging factor aMBF1 [Candidatus Bathyarchaeota archaeon]
MRCEVCGRKIFGKPLRVIIEGAKLTVCNECSKHGTTIWEETKPKVATPKPKATLQPLKTQSKKTTEAPVDAGLELIENFDSKIRQAREKLGLSHEELGKKINEKISVLKKIETGKIKPDNVLTTKLERALKVRLLVPASEEKTPQTNITKTSTRELTLGDLIQLNKKDTEREEDKTERKQS